MYALHIHLNFTTQIISTVYTVSYTIVQPYIVISLLQHDLQQPGQRKFVRLSKPVCTVPPPHILLHVLSVIFVPRHNTIIKSTKRRRSKSALSTNSFFYIREIQFIQKIQQKQLFLHTHSTKRQLTVIVSSIRNPSELEKTPEPP